MEILVCIKQVPGSSEVKINPQTGALIRESAAGMINPTDKNALEESLRLKAKHGGSVTALTMGPQQAEESLREALAMGVDKAVLLTDRLFAGSDTAATSYILWKAVQKLGHFDLILCGRESTDGGTAQVGPQLAELLDIPQVTFVRKVEIHNNTIRAERGLKGAYEIVEGKLPLLLTINKEINAPREITIDDILAACREKEIISWGAEDIGADRNMIGLDGSLTVMLRSYVPVREKKGVIFTGPVKAAVRELVRELRKKQLIP